MLTWLLAAVHLVGVAAAFAAIGARAVLLRRLDDPARLRPIFLLDNLWAATAVVLIGTGLWRLLGMTDKVTAYYLGNGAFWLKMALLAAILALEVRPMITLIRWRAAHAKGRPIDLGPARALARISLIQAHLLMVMIFAATAMARGLFN